MKREHYSNTIGAIKLQNEIQGLSVDQKSMLALVGCRQGCHSTRGLSRKP
jgi:hypothetical protein